MTRRSHLLAAAVLGWAVTQPLAGRAAEPVSVSLPTLSPTSAAPKAAAPPALGLDRLAAPAGNGEVANAVADALRQAGKAGQLRHYNIDVTVKDGTTALSGTVANAQQREEAMKLVKAVAGVGQVVDRLTLLAPSPITQVQATSPAAPPAPAPGGLGGPAVVAPPELAPPPQIREPVAPPPQFREPLPPNALPPGQAGVIPEPLPTFVAPMPSPYDLNPPLMPPYAWPTYAPYNNFSRVAYPLAYPYQSWPYIGPCYPFPKIPPGWRSVKLEWEDGHWWFSRIAGGNNWWRLRFW
jgi:hypothetical protein